MPLETLSQLFTNNAITIGFLILGFVLLTIFFSLVIQAASILILGRKDDTVSFGSALGQGFRLALPLFLLMIITGLLNFGGLFVFFLLAILFTFFFMFSPYELVLEKQGIKTCLRRSYQIVTQNFGSIFLSLIVFFLTYIIFIIFIPNLILRLDAETGFLVMLLRSIAGFFIGWYAFALSLTLYNHAKTRTDYDKPANLLWVVIVAVIGWLIAALIIFSSFTFIKKYVTSRLNDATQKQTQLPAGDLNLIPSSCGISLPVPKTTDTKDGKDRKWIYEEIALQANNFTPLDQDVHPRSFVLGAYLGYRNKPFAANTTTFITDFPGLVIKCTENPKGFTLDEYISLTQANKDFQVEVGNRGRWGEVNTAFVTISGKSKVDNQEFKDVAYLAVSRDKHRLIYLTSWSPADDDPNKDQINKDSEIILRNLKYRDVPETLIEPQREKSTIPALAKTGSSGKTTTTPGCKQFTIREGEFTSDKCYSSKDYDDLSYYINRFNDAIFSYNGAAGQANVTCNGFTDQFKQMCDQAKKDMDKAKADQENYRNTIKGIIARGK